MTEPAESPTALMSSVWLKDKLSQTATVGGIATLLAAGVWGAGYLVIMRRHVTLGAPNTASATTAYQAAGTEWLLDAGRVASEFITTGWSLSRFVITIGTLLGCLGIGYFVRRRLGRPARIALVVTLLAGHVAMAAMIAADMFGIVQRFDASLFLTRNTAEIGTLNSRASDFVDAFVRGDPTSVRAGYSKSFIDFIAVAVVVVFLAWAIHKELRPSKVWRPYLIAGQSVVAAALFVQVTLLAQFYGLITAITVPRCVKIEFSPTFEKALDAAGQDTGLVALLVSDLAFGGSEVSLVDFKPPITLWVYPKSSITKFSFYERSLCVPSEWQGSVGPQLPVAADTKDIPKSGRASK